VKTASYPIGAGDYEHAGSASSGLKELLKKVGVEPDTLRRAMIAAYEAEMNVVIHSVGGQMQIALDDRLIDVVVADGGPGIPDVDLAMKEGYSTAPPKARQLGFGAGLGLPNIRKNSDQLEIESAAGQGTRLHFVIHLRPQAAAGSSHSGHSIRVVAERCRGDVDCVRACPTRALRVRRGQPTILEHLCIDCGVCVAACEAGALVVNAPRELEVPSRGSETRGRVSEDTVLVVPTAFLAQFGQGATPKQVAAVLGELGFGRVVATAAWEEALRGAVLRYAAEEARKVPVLSPVCPAVLNLIEVRFPSLIDHVAPFLTPAEAAQRELGGRRVAFVASCSAQCTALRAGGAKGEGDVAVPAGLLSTSASRLDGRGGVANDECRMTNAECRARNGEPGACESRPLQVNGIRHVVRVLEMVENGLLEEARAIELYVCDEGCFGSPLWMADPFVARHRWQQAQNRPDAAAPRSRAEVLARAIRRERRLAARPGLRLDPDMAKAIAKLGEIDRLARSLPGKNCSRCGAPTCLALAEDIVLGRAQASCAWKEE